MDSNMDDLPEVQCSNEGSTSSLEPYLKQEFMNLQDVHSFYNLYALNNGFGIRKASSSKSQTSGDLIWKKYECDKSGFKIKTNDGKEDIVRRRETKVGCLAKLEVRRNKQGKWAVTQFIKEHNHALDTPQRTKRHRSHKTAHRSVIAKNLMDQLHDSGLGPSKIAKALSAPDGSTTISTQNVIDHLKIKRKNNIGREGELVASYLNEKNSADPNFYYALELDAEGYLRSIFWADSRARQDYFTFGDVIVFDVTYKTNHLMMPFAPFTGINHHRQSTLFGCALLADETEETFLWLFQQWLQCMFHKAPAVIITDMDKTMYKAIKKTFSNTRHRFCSWHISKHLIEHVHLMRDPESDFSKDYKKWFNSKQISSSEKRWDELVQKYNITDNEWLTKMWQRRTHWVPAFLKDVFVSGMTSSGRSESMNAFFDGFVNSRTYLIEFIKQYEHALIVRREAEKDEDFKTINSTASLLSQNPIEAHAGNIYTRKMFALFQKEFKLSLDYWHKKKSESGTAKLYIVGLPSTDTLTWSTVTYDEFDGVVASCSCAKFEVEGYLCGHVLHLMIKKHLTSIPEQYILNRWTINARHFTHDVLFDSTSGEQVVTPIMKWSLSQLANKIIEQSSKSVETYIDLYTCLNLRLTEFNLSENEQPLPTLPNQIASSSYTANLTQISIKDPTIVRTKGRPKNLSRITSGIENSQSIIKKRTCGSCGEKGHYSTTCPHKDNVKEPE